MNKGTGISFDALFSNASMGIIVANEAGEIVLANPFLLKQFGYTEQEVIGAPIEKLIPARFHAKHVHHVQQFHTHPINRPMGLGMDLFAARKDKSEFPVEVSLGNYETEQGKFVIAFLSDISRRKEAELSLKQLNEELEAKIAERTLSLTGTVRQLAQVIAATEAKDVELNRINGFLNNIWNHAEAIIYVTDPEGIIKMYNPTAEKELGYTATEIINKESPVFFHDKEELFARSREFSIQLEQELIPGFHTLSLKADMGLPNEYENTFVRKDKTTFPVSQTITAMRDPSGVIEGYLGIAIDISERKKAEMDLRLALEKEKELSELKSRFVSMASHEFRTPLSTVLSSAYLISKYENKEDHPKRERHVQRIVSSVNMLTDILNDFLSVGKIEEGKIQVRLSSFSLEQHILQIINELSGLLKKGQTIRYHHEGDDMVVLDASLLKHIIMNLLSNAVKFSPEDKVIELNTSLHKEQMTLSVTDKGIGIPMEDQQYLFGRFFRGNNAVNIQGTGLGLHIVSKYAELMNGTIVCRSELEQGTTFEINFRLPEGE